MATKPPTSYVTYIPKDNTFHNQQGALITPYKIYIYIIHPWIHPAPWGPPFYRCKTEKWHFGICKMWSPPKNRLTVKLWSPGYSKTICFELPLCKMITL